MLYRSKWRCICFYPSSLSAVLATWRLLGNTHVPRTLPARRILDVPFALRPSPRYATPAVVHYPTIIVFLHLHRAYVSRVSHSPFSLLAQFHSSACDSVAADLQRQADVCSVSLLLQWLHDCISYQQRYSLHYTLLFTPIHANITTYDRVFRYSHFPVLSSGGWG